MKLHCRCLDVIQATKIVEQYFSQGDSVALESVFSDTKGHKLDLLKKARNVGYKTCLIFIGLESSQLCIARVIDRVENGGHDVPDELIEDRYQKCFKNLVKASSMVDAVLLVDNSSLESHREFGYFEDNQFLFVSGFVPLWFESVKEAFL